MRDVRRRSLLIKDTFSKYFLYERIYFSLIANESLRVKNWQILKIFLFFTNFIDNLRIFHIYVLNMSRQKTRCNYSFVTW